jgi:prolipoprotein diacylglyceryl transferase
VGAWIVCSRRGVPLPALADAVAPGIVLAQAIGRFGNWFNQELFGSPTTLPWGLQIDPENRPVGFEQFETFHPTFLYEALWNVGVALLVIWADRRFRLGHGRAFALYVAAYTAGRTWIEYLRIDPAENVLGLRLNVWVSLLVFVGAVAYIVVSARRHPGREDPEELRGGARPDEVEPAATGPDAAQPDPAQPDSAEPDPAEPGVGARDQDESRLGDKAP